MFVAPDGFGPAGNAAMTPGQSGRQQAFRQRVMARIIDSDFGSPDRLAAAVMAALADHLLRPVLQEMQAGVVEPVSARARASPRKSWWQRAFGGRSQAPVPMAAEAQASGTAPRAQPATALAQFASDPDFADLIRDPATFNVRDLEAAVTERAEARARAGRADLRAAAADYKRLAALVGLYDINKSRAAYARPRRSIRATPTLSLAGQLSMDAGNTREARQRSFASTHCKAPTLTRMRRFGHFGLGDLRVSQGQLDSAIAAIRRGKTSDRLARPTPTTPDGSAIAPCPTPGWARADGAGHLREALNPSATPRHADGWPAPRNAGWQYDLGISNERMATFWSLKEISPKH